MEQNRLESAALDSWIKSMRGEYERTLARWVEIPSVSLDPDHRQDIERQVDSAVDAIRRAGGEVAVIPTPGNPVLHADFDFGPGAPTVTVYNHLDVQPATEPEWTSDPFVFRRDGERYLGRGATDDKGPALAALFAARYAQQVGLPVNLKFIWELEEEIGSPNFESALRQGGADLATDVVAVSDTVWVSRGRPAVPTGLRGSQMVRITLETGTSDQHSGVTGGVARNPVAELAWLASEMHDARTGRVKIPGFYDDVDMPSRSELDGFRRSGFTASGFIADHGFRKVRTRNPLEMMKRLWAEPTFEIHGLTGGWSGPGVKAIVPPRAELKISMRLVPDQEPQKIVRSLTAFVRRHLPDARVEAAGTLPPYRGVASGPFLDAIDAAYRFGFGTSPALVREGGSIGAVLTMEKRLRCPVLFLGLSLPEHGYHAPNEFFDWGQASGGIRTLVAFFDQVATMGRAGVAAARQATRATRSGRQTARRRPARKK